MLDDTLMDAVVRAHVIEFDAALTFPVGVPALGNTCTVDIEKHPVAGLVAVNV